MPLTKEEEKKHNKQKVCHICKKGFSSDDNNKKYHKVKDHRHYTGKYRGAVHDICNLRYKHHLIIKKLAKEFEGELERLGENTENYITFGTNQNGN